MVEKKNGTSFVSIQDWLTEDDTEYAEVPAFKEGDYFRIKSLTAGDMIEWSEANEGEAKRTAGLRLIIKSVVDEHGKLALDDSNLIHLRKKNHKTTDRLVKEILKHNGLDVKAQADVKKD
jgi:hypothetical protein